MVLTFIMSLCKVEGRCSGPLCYQAGSGNGEREERTQGPSVRGQDVGL